MKLTKPELKQIIEEELNEVFEIPGAGELRTLAGGLDKAFAVIGALEERIKILEGKLP